MSAYHGLQTKVEKQFGNGLNFLSTYTYAKTMTDAGDLLNGGSVAGYRAPSVPGLGMAFDYGLADFDIRNVFHLSGGYELPFGKGKRFASDVSGLMNTAIGGWSAELEYDASGRPADFAQLPVRTRVQPRLRRPLHRATLETWAAHRSNGLLSWFGNPGAFTQPACLDRISDASRMRGPNGC